MSGGHYDYAYLKVIEFADCVERDLREPKDWMNYSPECMLKLKQIAIDANKFAGIMKDVEWLLSGDISEKTFLCSDNLSNSKNFLQEVISILKDDSTVIPTTDIPALWQTLKNLEPISRGESLHIFDMVYELDEGVYTALWEIGQIEDEPFEISRKSKA